MLTKQWSSAGLCQFAMIERRTGEFTGLCGIRPTRHPGVGELGFIVAPAAWGRGYATEAATATVDWAFSELHLSDVIADDVINPASIRILTKLGIAASEVGIAPNGEPATSRAIPRDRWRQRAAQDRVPPPTVGG